MQELVQYAQLVGQAVISRVPGAAFYIVFLRRDITHVLYKAVENIEKKN